MLKWLLGIVVAGGFILWLKRGKSVRDVSAPEVKELDQKRFYVTPPEKDDLPPDDDQGTKL
ncbi:MAG: hypothetical protein CSA50_03125 [Gammaproteobacteria bacterium]|nr:MAG: hypothetical protein CSA50_03125 [Gammaproteobacteria bacterium]